MNTGLETSRRSLATDLHYQVIWRLAFLLVFFILPGLVDQSQLEVRNTLSPLRRAVSVPAALFLLLYSYRQGRELLVVSKRIWRWALPLLFGALLVALCLLIVLGTEGEIWLLKGIALFAVVSVVRHTIRFMAGSERAAPLLGLADLAYIGSVFFAALSRYYQQWDDLAAIVLGNIRGVKVLAPSAAVFCFLLMFALFLISARFYPSQNTATPQA